VPEYHDETDIGGKGGTFLTTHWSLVEYIQSDGDKNRELIGLLLDRYWKPVYCYLRHKGYDNEEAKDLTQGFFHEVVLNRNLIQRADQSKGRFRTFLLHALDQHLLNEKRRRTTQKRSPSQNFSPSPLQVGIGGSSRRITRCVTWTKYPATNGIPIRRKERAVKSAPRRVLATQSGSLKGKAKALPRSFIESC